MKRKNIILFLIFACCYISKVESQTAGTLTFTVTTSPAGGGFAPKHIMAIWITDNSGTFIKTRLRKAQAEVQYLTHWVSNSSQNVVDATTGATMLNHNSPNSPCTVTWDGKDVSGNIVTDGIYKLCIELTDKDATGNYSTFTFVKGTTQQLQNPASQSSFSNMTLNWVPSSTFVNSNSFENNSVLAYPNPFNSETNLILYFKEFGPANINIFSIKGELIKVILNQYVNAGNFNLKWDGRDNNNNIVSEGIYFFTITTNNYTYKGKLIFTK